MKNSISRVAPETRSSAAAATSHLPTPRPASHAAPAPTMAPPAAIGAITLPIQLINLRNVPSGWAAVSPWTATLVAGAAPRFCAHSMAEGIAGASAIIQMAAHRTGLCRDFISFPSSFVAVGLAVKLLAQEKICFPKPRNHGQAGRRYSQTGRVVKWRIFAHFHRVSLV